MKLGRVKVDQITRDGVLVEDYDVSLSPTEICERILQYFPNIKRSTTDQRFFTGSFHGKRYAIRCKNITYLGNPHPEFKKRIQIAEDLYDFSRFSKTIDAVPILLGIYTYSDNTIFVNFSIDTYIEKKAHNSSAHIYVSDLAAATEDGYFQKVDYFGNTVTAVRADVVNVLLEELLNTPSKESETMFFSTEETIKDPSCISVDIPSIAEGKSIHLERETDLKINSEQRFVGYARLFTEQIAPKIQDFFLQEKKDWYGIDCYKKMINDNYRNKYQPEWVGFFLEYEFEKYLNTNGLLHLITYAQDKKDGGIDLDLFFPSIKSYGDLKAHSEDSRGIQGNDWDTVFGIINNQDESSHVYYIVCEHSTEKDSIHDYEVTRYWNTVQKKDNLMSYSTRMKNRIRLKKMYILDINYFNKEYLTQFKQGLNSNGKPRAPKIMIEHDNLHHFIVKQLTL